MQIIKDAIGFFASSHPEIIESLTPQIAAAWATPNVEEHESDAKPKIDAPVQVRHVHLVRIAPTLYIEALGGGGGPTPRFWNH